MATSKEIFTFFYRTENPFSQWHPSKFIVDGIEYNCAEQYMMHQKAVLFGDEETGQQILAHDSPRKQKSLGRNVTPFDNDVWAGKCQEIIFKANYHKFTQNSALLDNLLATQGTTLVEASPSDKIYGIGLDAKNPLALDRKTWKGKNLLGETLTAVRQKIIDEKK